MANSHYTAQAARALKLARQIAENMSNGYIGTEHLIAGLLREGHGTAAMILSEAGVSYDRFMEMVDVLISPGGNGDITQHPEYTPKAEQILKAADEAAARLSSEKTGTEHILLAILEEPDCVATRLLFTMDFDLQNLYINTLRAGGESEATIHALIEDMGRDEEKAGDTPTLDKYSQDLTEKAREGKLDPVIGRDEEISRVIEILSRRTKNNPCLVGEPGVGKTAVVEGLATRIVRDEVPDSVRGKRLVVLDLSGMVAGSKYRGEFEQRIKKVIAEVSGNRNILLFIDEIHTIIGAGGAEGALDASNILKPSLSRGEIQLIGATTLDEYRKRIEKDAALERRFQQVTVEEPTKEEAYEILKGLRPCYEHHHRLKISDGAIHAAVDMSVRYINDRFLPDKAIDLMDEASAKVRLSEGRSDGKSGKIAARIQKAEREKETALRKGDVAKAGEIQRLQNDLKQELQKTRKKSSGRVVTENDIARTVSQWTKIPLEKIAESESRRLSRLESSLHKRVVGQDEAVTAVAKAVRRGRVGLKDPDRPIGSFLFLGPTGVGKTELSKALADAVFGSESAMIRVDMSEYMEKHSVSKLIGSPPGYVGYEEGGQLSEKVRRHPYSVILFDEIEKAHPDVFNILLQVLDDGHITDAQGRKVNFKDTIIIMTSNAGANRIIRPKHLGFGGTDTEKEDYEHMKEQVMDEVRQLFRPEFLNRIDEILVFHPLTMENMRSIINILLSDLTARCQDQMDIRLRVTDGVKDRLIKDSFDAKYGARPLKRAIQSRLEDPLAEQILSGKIHRGKTVTVRLSGNEPVFRES
ncbi:MAG: ATP-dependent Clp protease ATP-binding subunit [Bilifractor sp.]